MRMKLYKLIYRILFGWGIYLWWSKRYRRIYQAGYTLLPGTNTLDAVVAKIKLLKWTKDGARELWDAVGSPKWVQYCVDQIKAGHGQPEGSLDCDEFAVYASALLPTGYDPIVLNVVWADKGMLGHHVCMYRLDDGKYYHLGNWGNMGPFESPSAVVLDVVKKGHGENTLVGWARFTHDLVLRDYGTSVETIQ